MQLIPKFDEYNISDIKEYDEKAFDIFRKETKQNVQATIKKMETMHIEFSG